MALLREKLDLQRKKRQRAYATMIHFFYLGSQLWLKDRYSYKRPGTRVKVWAKIQDAAFTPSRIGELLESSCRSGTGRGLHYKVSDPSHKVGFQLIRDDLGYC